MDEATVDRVRRRWPRALAAILLGLSLLLLAIWIERRPIATRFVDRELARRKVPARYTIETIGLRRQRLTNVVIGDPADPDLVADWIVVETQVGLSGASVSGIRAGQARLRARWLDGVLSLGALDRLMGPRTGAPFALPELFAALDDVRLRIETPAGVVAAKLSGSGRLDDGFAGQLALVAPMLAGGGCAAEGAQAALRLSIVRRAPSVRGPVVAQAARCGDARLDRARAVVDTTLSATLDRWNGSARVAGDRLAAAGTVLRGIGGTARFAGSVTNTGGRLDLAARTLTHPQVTAHGARIAGAYQAGGRVQFGGTVAAERVTLARDTARGLANIGSAAPGTPVAAILANLGNALVNAAADIGGEARLALALAGGRGAATLSDLRLASRSGARAAFAGEGVRIAWPQGTFAASGVATIGGGGLPDARVAFGLAPGGAVTGTAQIAPLTSRGARLALAPATFRFSSASGRIVTRAELSGPLSNGRVDGLALPIDARWGGELALNPGCTLVTWKRLAVSSLVLAPARLTLCAVGGALASYAGGRLGGGMRVTQPHLTGRIGSSPLSLATSSATLRLGDLGFAFDGVAARIGAPERETRIDAGSVTGRMASGGARGSFARGAAQIGTVPMLLSEAAGTWTFAGGRLSIEGALAVADAAEADRFNPVRGRDVSLTLHGNAIRARGTLVTPKNGSKVADVAIDHDLSAGVGRAELIVRGIIFAENGLQPSDLTPLTYGVIAAVGGRVEGRGDVAWTPAGVTSTGRFRTDGTNLAAAFGPVTGLSGEITFTDLLGLVSAPGQRATVVQVNPGIPVENGVVRYRLIGGTRVQVDGARWPFAGGELVLEPALLDFANDQQRRMTFRVIGADAATFLQQFEFENINATGIFDGVLPMVFDQSGGRIVDGRLTARGGGSVAYVGAVSQENLGTWGNLAFDALKALDYRDLDITMNGALAGEMVTQIRFSGVSQGAGTKSNFIIRRLAKLPFVFNIEVRAPFRQLLDSVQSFYDPKRLIERNLPSLMEEQRRRTAGERPPIQPPESERRP